METTDIKYEHEHRYEEERGKPVPSRNHSSAEIRLGAVFLRYEPEYTPFTELSLALEGWSGTPDVCVYPRMDYDPTQDDEVRMTEPPLIAVEIASPTQSQESLVDKIRQMLAAGVQSCWLVQPAIRAVTVFSAEEPRPRTITDGAVTDPATGIEVALDDIFPNS